MIGSLCVIRKMFPYMCVLVDQVRPHRTRQSFYPLVRGLSLIRDPSSVCQGDAPISFIVGPSVWPSAL